MRWRGLLAGAGLVVLAVATWWLSTRGDKATAIVAVLTLTVAVLALAVQVFGVSWPLRPADDVSKIRSPGEPGRSRALDDVADLLAGAVKDQWTRAAADRGLLHPPPIPVRWTGHPSRTPDQPRPPRLRAVRPMPGCRRSRREAAAWPASRTARRVRGARYSPAGDRRCPGVRRKRRGRAPGPGRSPIQGAGI